MTFRVCTTLALLALCATPARADWMFSHYRGDSHARANTLKVTRAAGSGSNLSLAGVDYDGDGWNHPVYYGYRLSHFFKHRPHLGFELEMTHAKTIADTAQTVSVNGANVPLSAYFQRLEYSHGLNLAIASIALRRPLAANGPAHRVLLIGRAGGGLTFPHNETVFDGVKRHGYQYGGPAWAIGGGVEYQIVGGLNAIADLRLSTAYEKTHIGPNGSAVPTMSGPFLMGHFGVGLGYRLGKRP